MIRLKVKAWLGNFFFALIMGTTKDVPTISVRCGGD
jgi:hypothetical protein